MSNFPLPNYTQTPNIFFDEMIKDMKEAELRVALVIMRETFGWHRESKWMSLSYLMQATGMSKQGVLNGVEAGVERGIFARIPYRDSYSYRLLVNEVDHQGVNEVDRGSQRSRPPLVNEVDHQGVNEVDTKKERVKERDKKTLKETQPVLTNPWDDDDKELKDSIVRLITGTYVTAFNNIRSVHQKDSYLSGHVALAERYGWEAYVRGFNAAVADEYRSGTKAEHIEHFITSKSKSKTTMDETIAGLRDGSVQLTAEEEASAQWLKEAMTG